MNSVLFHIISIKNSRNLPAICRNKKISPETFLQSTGAKKHLPKPSCNLQEQKNISRNLPAIYRSKKISPETFLQSTGTKKYLPKPSCNLQEQKNISRNLPAIYRNKKTSPETSLQQCNRFSGIVLLFF